VSSFVHIQHHCNGRIQSLGEDEEAIRAARVDRSAETQAETQCGMSEGDKDALMRRYFYEVRLSVPNPLSAIP
jgi:hypothetical protein